jgi:large subunit ribosomal protein L18
MNLSKKERRARRAIKTRAKIREQGTPRLTVHRTPRHIYAQLFAADGSQVLATASTVQKALVKDLKYTGNIEAARAVGRAIAERAKAAALAEAARESGLEF